jgi:hypothetical protein
MPNSEFEELWEEFNNIEVEESLHYSNISILSRLMQIASED